MCVYRENWIQGGPDVWKTHPFVLRTPSYNCYRIRTHKDCHSLWLHLFHLLLCKWFMVRATSSLFQNISRWCFSVVKIWLKKMLNSSLSLFCFIYMKIHMKNVSFELIAEKSFNFMSSFVKNQNCVVGHLCAFMLALRGHQETEDQLYLSLSFSLFSSFLICHLCTWYSKGQFHQKFSEWMSIYRSLYHSCILNSFILLL
jgi:hypothetical protein